MKEIPSYVRQFVHRRGRPGFTPGFRRSTAQPASLHPGSTARTLIDWTARSQFVFHLSAEKRPRMTMGGVSSAVSAAFIVKRHRVGFHQRPSES